MRKRVDKPGSYWYNVIKIKVRNKIKEIKIMTNEVKIMCKNCKHWGGNNQKVINSTGCSKCLVLKKMAHTCQHCTGHYEPKEKK